MGDNRRDELKAKIDGQLNELTTEELEQVAGGGLSDILKKIPMYECASCGKLYTNGDSIKLGLKKDTPCPQCGGVLEFSVVKAINS